MRTQLFDGIDILGEDGQIYKVLESFEVIFIRDFDTHLAREYMGNKVIGDIEHHAL